MSRRTDRPSLRPGLCHRRWPVVAACAAPQVQRPRHAIAAFGMGGCHCSRNVNCSRDRASPTDGRAQGGRRMHGDAMRFQVSRNPHGLVRRIGHQRRSIVASPTVHKLETADSRELICVNGASLRRVAGAESEVVEPARRSASFKAVLAGKLRYV